jgi:hypothetical protein
LSLCLTNYALSHEDVWGGGRIDAHLLDLALVGSEWSASRPVRSTAGERATGTHWIGGSVGPRAGVGDVENRENSCPYWDSNYDPLGHPARSQSLYRLRYLGSSHLMSSFRTT